MNLYALAVVITASVALILFVVCSIIPDFEVIKYVFHLTILETVSLVFGVYVANMSDQ
jgi:hypothetical protein